MGMTKRPQIGHGGTIRQEMANDEVGQHLQGGQGQVGGPQVPLNIFPRPIMMAICSEI